MVADPEVLGEPWKSSETLMSASDPLEDCVTCVAPQIQPSSFCYRFRLVLVVVVEFGMRVSVLSTRLWTARERFRPESPNVGASSLSQS